MDIRSKCIRGVLLLGLAAVFPASAFSQEEAQIRQLADQAKLNGIRATVRAATTDSKTLASLLKTLVGSIEDPNGFRDVNVALRVKEGIRVVTAANSIIAGQLKPLEKTKMEELKADCAAWVDETASVLAGINALAAATKLPSPKGSDASLPGEFIGASARIVEILNASYGKEFTAAIDQAK